MLNNFSYKVLNFIFLTRMLKDKSVSWLTDYFYGRPLIVNRINENNNNTILNHIYKFSYKSTLIIDNIYLGNGWDASSYYDLKANNITTIINVTNEIPNYYEAEFNYFNIPVRDTIDSSMILFFNDVLEFLKKYKNQNILIHCYHGSSRSSTIVLLHLIINYKMSIEEGLKLLKEKREIVNLNKIFFEELKTFKENY